MTTFLPEDYLARRAERRTDIICLTLFVVVMAGVFAAFLITNREWAEVKEARRVINAEYQDAAAKIAELTELQAQEAEMLEKAELASALVERAPRSILLAEFINRMPARLSLIEFNLLSEKIKPQPSADSGSRSISKPKRGKTRAQVQAEQAEQKATPDRFEVAIEMVGVAPTDLEVSSFITELNQHELLQDVTLEYSEETELQGQMMREFKVVLSLDPDADMREVEPLIKPRLRDPMSDQLNLGEVATVPIEKGGD